MDNSKLSHRILLRNVLLTGACIMLTAALFTGCTINKPVERTQSKYLGDERPVLYLGDSALRGPAAYLAGVMTFRNISFDHVPSGQKFKTSLLDKNYAAVIISDYPAANFTPDQLQALTEKVKAGTGLLMLGGWTSFSGAAGEYTDTILKEVLPVIMHPGDDRINSSGTCLVEKIKPHRIVDSLPFDKTPPTIGGYNLLKAKPDASTILVARQFNISHRAGRFNFTPLPNPAPLLVVGSFGKGRVAAFATDVAPHWVGGLVDWGNTTIKTQAPNARTVEVGDLYAELFANMIDWTAGKL